MVAAVVCWWRTPCRYRTRILPTWLPGLCRLLSWVTWLFRIDFVSGCSSPISGCATWLGLVRRPGDISRTSLYIAVLVLTIYDEVSVFASVRAAARGYLLMLATRSRSPAP
jgi:hypothetical protein